MIDLHTHSSVSDGSEPPAAIPELAAAAGCTAVALTDHDSLAGLPEAARSAADAGIRLVAGCEVSCRKPVLAGGAHASGSMHVLCYFVEDGGGPLQDELRSLRADRQARNRALVARLADLGVPVSWDDVVAEAGTEAGVGRPHFARVLVRIGAAQDVDDAFDRWLADDRPAYVPKARLHGADVVRLAGASGAVAVLAHPLSLGLAPPALESAVRELADAGLGGIEATYGRYTPEDRRQLRALAERAGVVATGGSDFHGTFKPDLRVGTGLGDLDVPDDVLDELEARRP
ncbi:MAG: PHP domain-containing protein [Acidimicrobiales bacterium]